MELLEFVVLHGYSIILHAAMYNVALYLALCLRFGWVFLDVALNFTLACVHLYSHGMKLGGISILFETMHILHTISLLVSPNNGHSQKHISRFEFHATLARHLCKSERRLPQVSVFWNMVVAPRAS